MKKLYVIEFENSTWCGGQAHCVAWAYSAMDAEYAAGAYMDEYQYDLFYDHFQDYPDMDDGCYTFVNSVELLEDSDIKEFYDDPAQREAFYPCVNPEDEPK